MFLAKSDEAKDACIKRKLMITSIIFYFFTTVDHSCLDNFMIFAGGETVQSDCVFQRNSDILPLMTNENTSWKLYFQNKCQDIFDKNKTNINIVIYFCLLYFIRQMALYVKNGE